MNEQVIEAPLLPQKLNLEMVASLLKLSHLSQESQLYAIVQYQRDHGLIIKSVEPLLTMAQKTSHGFYESIDPNDETITYMASEVSFEVQTDGHIITVGPLQIVAPSTLQFSQFSIDGIDMYPVDEDCIYLSTLTCNIGDLYVDKDDFEDFINEGIDKIPPYADPASEHYAPELALAIQLHDELRVQKRGNLGLNMKDRVHTWLKKRQPNIEISDAQLNRLATVIGAGKKLPNP